MLKRATTNTNQSAAAVFTWTKVPKAARSGFGPRVMVRPINSLPGKIHLFFSLIHEDSKLFGLAAGKWCRETRILEPSCATLTRSAMLRIRYKSAPQTLKAIFALL